jgi:phosphoribosyl 1,2-cyclic phosphodiesterase
MDADGEMESMHFSVLGSGSGGNGAVVAGPEGALLIDAGLSARQTLSRLEAVGVAAAAVRGVLLTHEHGDHTRGLDVLLRGPLAGVPVFANPHTCEMLRPTLRSAAAWRLVETGSVFDCAGWRVETFSVPHDAVDPMGFVIGDRAGAARLGVLSDLGHSTTAVLARLRELDALFVEANHCPRLLAADTRRPWSTKQRIAGRHGHLSNDQAAALVVEVLSPRLQRLWLGHLSADCNCPTVATEVVRRALASRSADHVEVWCAGQHEPTPLTPIGRVRPPAGQDEAGRFGS